MEKEIYNHIDGKEFAKKCHKCGSEIKFVREGSISNPVSDITECDCLIIEHENGLNIMGNHLRFGNTKILKRKILAP